MRPDRQVSQQGRIGRMAVCLTIAAVLACSNKPPENKNYASKIAADRAAKDAAFRRDSEPVPDSRKAELLPLAYFSRSEERRVGKECRL